MQFYILALMRSFFDCEQFYLYTKKKYNFYEKCLKFIVLPNFIVAVARLSVKKS